MKLKILGIWHRSLGLAKYEPRWYRARLVEELAERRKSKSYLSKLSETCDVYYIIQRAQLDGYPLVRIKFNVYQIFPIIYMVLKYSSRWGLYRICGILSRAEIPIREVINPLKSSKIKEVAMRSKVDFIRFEAIVKMALKFWPLLP